jgi:hypothetical protein
MTALLLREAADRLTICRVVGHHYVRTGQHKIGGVPSHYQSDMDSVPRGTLTYDDYRCTRCRDTQSEPRPYSWVASQSSHHDGVKSLNPDGSVKG